MEDNLMKNQETTSPVCTKVLVKVPATTANMGPGFDCFGCAFQMYNTLTFEILPEKKFEFEGFEEEYANEDNLAVQGYLAVLKHLDLEPKGLKVTIKTDIPICRGLGSSSSLLAAGAIAANALHGSTLDKDDLLMLTTRIEGHPDNLAPCLFGGMTASMMVDGKPVTVRYFINPEIEFVALIPDFEFPTSKARAALPKALVYQDAVFNISRGGVLLKALENGDERLIRLAMDDRLHEPYREMLIEGSRDAERIARECDAMGFCLSGSGPTFMCLTKDSEFLVRIKEKIGERFPTWTVRALNVDYKGATYQKLFD